MSTSRTQELEAMEQETLERQLAQISLELNDPLNLLGQLAQALFEGLAHGGHARWMINSRPVRASTLQ